MSKEKNTINGKSTWGMNVCNIYCYACANWKLNRPKIEKRTEFLIRANPTSPTYMMNMDSNKKNKEKKKQINKAQFEYRIVTRQYNKHVHIIISIFTYRILFHINT